ncbi:hypothetical protein AVEN_117469-1 [Araneus ventricosus]|uniref:BTB domain-containing protein n=1 Tax=Araneus ventricosus TaxID=182803 RepID=A0A4Y2HUF7_ARAVE|nr:hypothetical protein AVEN_117469-1 [Araneus ventricosus]
MKRNITTSWSLLLYPSTPKNCVSCILRKESRVPLNFLVGYELSFLHEDGSPLHSIKVSSADFNYKNKSVQLWLHHDEILENKGASLAEDTLSVRCRIWTADTPIQEMVRYFAETEIKVQRCTLTWHILAFSDLKPGKKRTEFVNMLTGNPCIYFSLFLDKWNSFIFEIFVLDPKFVELCKCQIFLVDVSGKKLKCGRFEVLTIGKTTDPDWKFHLSLTKRNLMETKELYLPNDTLTLQCEAAFATGIEAEPVQKLESDCQNIQNIPCNAETENISTSLKKCSESLPASKNDIQSSNNIGSLKGKFVSLYPTESNSSTSLKANAISNSLLSWKDDLLILYENGTFCDAELLVTTSCFPVHSLILSVRSPVFCDLFTRAKSDGKRTSIHIEDLDADTVGKMILFLYTDTLEDLEWDCAKGLYLASNKYEILPLKDISSSFLKQNLSTINCCDILLLADKYKDDYLKQVVKDFIAEHDEVLNSDQWSSLGENHPRLTIETFHFMYLKFRKN